MRLNALIKRLVIVTMTLTLVPFFSIGQAAAAVETIYSEVGVCRWNVNHYQVQINTYDPGAPSSVFPASVSIHFVDGTVVEAYPLTPGFWGSQTYQLDDPGHYYREIPVLYATAQFDTALYPNYRFSIASRPCDPTPVHTVTGTIVQHGNMKAIAGLTVCLEELGLCTVTDANGAFALFDVPSGVYTLTSNGSNYKPLSTVIAPMSGDVHVDLVQNRGGGR